MFRAFSLAAAIAAFALAVLGSWIRINGAGMTCPDWPLCHGQIVPPLDGAVILEWSHRMVAFFEGFLVVGAIVTGWRERRAIAGVTPVLAALGAVFVVQVLLGGATVALSNSPWSVVLHWGAAMLFLGVLTTLALLAVLRPAPGTPRPEQSGLFWILGGSAAAAFCAMCAGAYVSSSGAGLACVTLPACDGSWAGNSVAQHAQMTHRLFAGVLFVLATVAVYWAALGAPLRVRVAGLAAYAFIVVQIMLGVLNIVWSMPIALRELHAANAGATFLAFVVAFAFARLDGTVRTVPARSAVRAQAMGTP